MGLDYLWHRGILWVPLDIWSKEENAVRNLSIGDVPWDNGSYVRWVDVVVR